MPICLRLSESDAQQVAKRIAVIGEKEIIFNLLTPYLPGVTLGLWNPNQVISDLVKLFELFAPDMKQLGFI